jgi:hypothetical protein
MSAEIVLHLLLLAVCMQPVHSYPLYAALLPDCALMCTYVCSAFHLVTVDRQGLRVGFYNAEEEDAVWMLHTIMVIFKVGAIPGVFRLVACVQGSLTAPSTTGLTNILGLVSIRCAVTSPSIICCTYTQES